MSNDDFASIVVAEVYERAAKIVPCLSDHCADEGNPLSQLQLIALGSSVLTLFADLEDTINGMCRTAEVLSRFRDDADFFPAEWLDSGPMQ